MASEGRSHDWWCTWQEHPISWALDISFETTMSNGTELTVSFSIYTSHLDPLLSAGFTREYKRPRPWVLDLSFPKGPLAWKWREP